MVRTKASAKDNLGGRVNSHDEQHYEQAQSVVWKILDDHVFDLKYCDARLSQHICEQYGANFCRPHSQPGTTFVFCTLNEKYNYPSGPRPYEAVPQELRFFGVFQNPRYASTMKQVCDGSHWWK